MNTKRAEASAVQVRALSKAAMWRRAGTLCFE